MYPFSIERRNIVNEYPSTFEDQEPMPKQCDEFSNNFTFWSMPRKALNKVARTPKLMEHYKAVGVFLKSHPEIQWRKLALGFEVDISTIPNESIEEWLNVTKFDYDKNIWNRRRKTWLCLFWLW